MSVKGPVIFVTHLYYRYERYNNEIAVSVIIAINQQITKLLLASTPKH